MLQKKICLLGSYSVGKTSLAEQFVHSRFSARYHSTLGVKVDRKVVDIEGRSISLMVWDVAGEDEHFAIPLDYVLGSAGCLLVADGTRPETFHQALDIAQRVTDTLGPLPMELLLNKCDLADAWKWDGEEAEAASPFAVHRTSARTGEGVEEAFRRLAARLL